jgi:hypothetical protein
MIRPLFNGNPFSYTEFGQLISKLIETTGDTLNEVLLTEQQVSHVKATFGNAYADGDPPTLSQIPIRIVPLSRGCEPDSLPPGVKVIAYLTADSEVALYEGKLIIIQPGQAPQVLNENGLGPMLLW